MATAETVILRENLRRLKDEKRIAEYQAIVAAEGSGLGMPTDNAVQATAR